MEHQTVIFIGPQGSGKGTQVSNLLQYLKQTYSTTTLLKIETGALFRALAQTGSATASRVKELLDAGQPVPDGVTNALVMEHFKVNYTPDAYIVLDGFPRNVSQAQYLDEILAFYDRPTLSVVYLETPEEVVRQRMRSRGRADDTEEGITERLRWSMQMMLPLLEYYRQRPNTNVVTVDGSQEVGAVFEQIKAGLSI